MYEAPREIKNKKERNELVEAMHKNPMIGAHSGYSRLLAKLKSKFYWKNMAKDILNVTRNCPKCQMNKHSKNSKENMTITTTPQRPFDVIELDIYVLPMVDLEGFKYVLTVQCNFSKFVILLPMRTKSAPEVARVLFEGFMYLHGIPKVFKSDCGAEFMNSLIKELEKILCIDHKFSVPYHPQSLGQLERNHRTLSEFLRIYIANHREWRKWLHYYAFAYNATG